MSCRIEEDKHCYQILGSLNHETVTSIHQSGAILLERSETVRFDFSHVDYADSSAIALCLSWLRLAKQNNNTIIFENVPAQLLEIATVCEVMPLLSSYVKEKPGFQQEP